MFDGNWVSFFIICEQFLNSFDWRVSVKEFSFVSVVQQDDAVLLAAGLGVSIESTRYGTTS
jgi:hypothetical protein